MYETSRFQLPLIAAAQAQKHITHNEALARLDKLLHLYVQSRSTQTPPAVSNGDAYIVPAGGTGEWAGADGQIAFFEEGVWSFMAPVAGLGAYIHDEAAQLVFDGANWQSISTPTSAQTLLAEGSLGAKSYHKVIETELSGLSGSSVTASGLIPSRAIVFCVSTRTSVQITGATAYNCGVAGEPSKFGGYLGTAAGSSNLGVIGPTAFYAPTDVVLTAQTAEFSGGAVKVAVHCFVPSAPG